MTHHAHSFGFKHNNKPSSSRVPLNVRRVYFSSVQLPDDGVYVCAAESGFPEVLEEARLVPGGVTGHRQLERHQEVVGFPEGLADRVKLVNQVLQTDNATFA